MLSKINEWVSLLANIGVIGSLIFLGLELRQNTDMIQSQTRDAMTEKQMQFYRGLYENDDVADLWVLARNFPDDIEDGTSDFWKWRFYWLTQLRMWENEWYQYQRGLFEEDEFLNRLELWRGIVNQTKYTEEWKTLKYSFSPTFQAILDGLIAVPN